MCKIFRTFARNFGQEPFENVSIHIIILPLAARSGLDCRYSDGEREPELARWYGGVQHDRG